MSEPLLRVRDLQTSFGGLTATDHASFTVEPGTITGLIGPNGAGKSTLFNLISAFLPPAGGQVHIAREDLTLPVAPIDRIARLRIDDRYRVGVDARIALADILEDYADNVASAAATLARHADRRTVQAEDIETYFALFE